MRNKKNEKKAYAGCLNGSCMGFFMYYTYPECANSAFAG
jgi:hypothetical protein